MMMAQRSGLLCLAGALVALIAVPVAAQRSSPRPGAAPAAPAAPQPMTRAEKAAKLYADATSLWQTNRPAEAAEMFESLVRRYPTSERIPLALHMAVRFYLVSDQAAKAEATLAVLRKKFPNNQNTMPASFYEVDRKCSRLSTVPLEEQIRLLEVYVDTYWAQGRFGEAIEMLAFCLMKNEQTNDLDALLSHVLADSEAGDVGRMINMIQRACGARTDHANMAKVYGDAAKDMDSKTSPASMAVRLLEIVYLRKAGAFDEGLKKASRIIGERPRSEHAAYCALELKPGVLADQKKPAEAADALRGALEQFGIFALPDHREQLADYETESGNHRAAIEVLDKLLSGPCWPVDRKRLLDKKHDAQIAAGDVDAAVAANAEIARQFPRTRVALMAHVRTVGDLLAAERGGDAAGALSAAIKTYAGDAAAAAVLAPYLSRAGAPGDAQVKAMREEFMQGFPAASQADEVRKALNMPAENSPAAQAKALFAEYAAFARESNVDAAMRRIERLFKEFPSSEHGPAAAAELSYALKKAGKVELAAQLNLLVAEHCPCHPYAESRLADAANAYNGVAKPDEAMKAYRTLVEDFRFSRNWQRYYVARAAETLDVQGKLGEARALVEAAAATLGYGPQATDLKAYMARRLEGQEKWAEAADAMLRLLGPNAANPAYRPLAGEATRFLIVAGNADVAYRKKEAALLENLANRYEGWDEADRIRISLAGTYARTEGDAYPGKAVALLDAVKKRHGDYEIGASGRNMIWQMSQYTGGLYNGTVGHHPMYRVENDMSGRHGVYLYAHTAEDMIDYVLLLRKPEAYVTRMKQRLTTLVKRKPARARGYKSGLPYRTKNVPRPRWHPWPEQRTVYHLVRSIEEGLHRMEPMQRLDAALWLEVHPLWPHYHLNDERMTAAACALAGQDKARFQKAVAILTKEYNRLIWEPQVLNAEANAERYGGSTSRAAALFRTLVTKYPDHTLAARAAQAVKDMGGRG